MFCVAISTNVAGSCSYTRTARNACSFHGVGRALGADGGVGRLPSAASGVRGESDLYERSDANSMPAVSMPLK
jgi:hypothetical protein